MDKQEQKITEKLVFIYLILFPFGQLPGFFLKYWLGIDLKLHPADLIVFLFLPFTVSLVSKNRPQWVKRVIALFIVSMFSLVFSLSIFSIQEVILGTLYLLRFTSYLAMAVSIYYFAKNRKENKEKLIKSLILVGIFVSIFGFMQYLYLPDLRTLKLFNWDDHLYRLVSTFLDPAYTGIILVFSLFSALSLWLTHKKKIYLYTLVPLGVSLALTYSRASFLAAILGVSVLAWMYGKKKLVYLSLLAVITAVFILPRPGGEGVKLSRVSSIVAKEKNFHEGEVLLQKSPLFGLGFNNVCASKIKYLGDENIFSNSCSGLDNSFLYILVTTGLVGGIYFLSAGIEIVRSTSKNIYGKIFLASAAALLFHSLFTNTLFYNFALGYTAILLGISRKN